MKIQIKYLVPLCLMLFTFNSCVKTQEIKTVPSVDLKKYAGLWYSIASYPQFFERGSSNIRATYTANDGYIEVYNQSTKDGEPNDIKGKAFIVENSGNAKLKVQFFWPFNGNYWIIDLANDYSWAVVSDPKMKTLWILSRTAKMDEIVYSQLIEKLVSKGFEKERIVKVLHD